MARSSTEAECKSLVHTAAQLAWIRTLLKDLCIYIHSPPIIWCDNINAMALAANLVFHARTKHVEVDCHFIRERVVRKDIDVRYVPTQTCRCFHERAKFTQFQVYYWQAFRHCHPVQLEGEY